MRTLLKTTKTPNLTSWVMAMSLVLTACGGGGSSTPATTPTPAPTPSATPTATPTPAPTPSATPTPTPAPTPSATPTATPTPTPTPTASECPIGNYQSNVHAAINAARAVTQSCGAATGALSWNSQLEAAAARHSTDMAANNYWGADPHTGTDGTTLRQRVPAAGYNYATAGENVAAGQTSASQVVADWIASPSHCSNIMTAAFVDIGVSCKYNPSSTYQYYWTLVMGKRQ